MNENNYVGYCEMVVRGVVSKPEEVRVTKTVDERGVLLSVAVAREDMGNVIGTKGATSEAIKRLLRVAGMMENAKVSVKILEPGEPPGSRVSGGKADPMDDIKSGL